METRRVFTREHLLHHSDRDSQHTGTAFQRLLGELGVTLPHGSIWPLAETPDRDATPRPNVFDYIERFYNPTRRYSPRAFPARLSTGGRHDQLKVVSADLAARHDVTVARIVADWLKSIRMYISTDSLDLANISRRYHAANGRVL